MDEISVKIKEAAYKEFLEKGFEKASMRNIAKTAGITTGAFYSRFENKDALYKTVFEDVTTKLERLFEILKPAYYRGAERGVGGILEVIEMEMLGVTGLIYDNYQLFQLLFLKSHGSEMEFYFDQIIDKKINDTLQYFKGFYADENTLRLILINQYETYKQIIKHDYSKEDAMRCLQEVMRFYKFGWKGILKK